MLQRWLQRLMATVFVIVLAACGGGGGGDSVPTPPPAATTLDVSAATVSPRKLNNALITQRAPGATAPLPELFFAWVKRWSEAANNGFFPGDPTTQSEVFGGVEYWTRWYSTGHLLAIRKSDSAVFVQWADRTLYQVGYLIDYACDVSDCAGGSTTGQAGVLDLSAALQRFVPDFVNGVMTYFGATDGKEYKPAVSDIKKLCWYSNRRGGWYNPVTKQLPAGCTDPLPDGTLAFTGMCSNDSGQVAVWTKSDVELWPDFKNPRGWKLAGDLEPKLVGDFIQYGNYRPSVVSYDKTSGSLTIDFGSDCLGGFSAPLVAGHMEFIWSSDKDGWERTSTKRGYLLFDPETKRHHTRIEGVSCGQRGQVALYLPKVVEGDKVKEWETAPHAWFAVPQADNANPFWQNGAGVSWFHQELLNRSEHAISLGC